MPHGNAPVTDLPVRGIVGGLYFIVDLTLPTAVCFMTALCAKKINYGQIKTQAIGPGASR